MARRLILVVNDPEFFVAQHMHVGVAAQQAGWEVHVAAPEGPGVDAIRAHGFPFHPIRMARGPVNPLLELQTVADLRRIYTTVRPDLVHHITLKSILYGTLAAQKADVPAVVNGNTGLGYAFIDEGWATRALRKGIEAAYRLAVRHPNRRDVFLNPDDYAFFAEHGLADPRTSLVIRGPGVDMDAFRPQPEPVGVPVVLLAARMLWHKGVGEFVEASRQLQARGVEARFVLAGKTDPGNPAAITREQLLSWQDEELVEWWGFQEDMVKVFAQSHVVTLPSYREGLGKVLIEAAACRRPLVATDVPGCREIARDGYNALLVPPEDATALADAIEQFVTQPAMRWQYGFRGRTLAEQNFGTDTVSRHTLAVYDVLTGQRAVQVQREVAGLAASSGDGADASLGLPVPSEGGPRRAMARRRFAALAQ